MAQKSSKKIALVTGASPVIGKALVIELLAQDYEVIAASRSQEKRAKLASDLKNAYLSILCAMYQK